MMQSISNTPSGLKRSTAEAVEIKLWEIYLLRNRGNIYSTLTNYSLDNGTRYANHITEHERISITFLVSDWQNVIQKTLIDNNIPFAIHSYFPVDLPQQSKRKVQLAEDEHISSSLSMTLEDARLM
jgi:hypothetical protein